MLDLLDAIIRAVARLFRRAPAPLPPSGRAEIHDLEAARRRRAAS